MREIRTSGSEGGGLELNRSSLPLSGCSEEGLSHDYQGNLTFCDGLIMARATDQAALLKGPTQDESLEFMCRTRRQELAHD